MSGKYLMMIVRNLTRTQQADRPSRVSVYRDSVRPHQLDTYLIHIDIAATVDATERIQPVVDSRPTKQLVDQAPMGERRSDGR
jgi:hypothetical protein